LRIVCFFPIGAGRQQAQPYSGNRDGKEAGWAEMRIRSMKERAQLFLPEEACERPINAAHQIKEWTGVRRSPETYRRRVLSIGEYIQAWRRKKCATIFDTPVTYSDDFLITWLPL